MIRVTVELLPFGFEENKQLLGVAEITNDVTGTPDRGNYHYRIWGKRGGKIIRQGVILAFPRRRLLAWDLLFRVLADAVGERNGR